MVCRTCEERRAEPPAGEPEKVERRGPVGDQLCSRCGNLLGPKDMVKRLKDKQSQLARFGLNGARGALFKRNPSEDR